MFHKFAPHIIDVAIGSTGVATIWGLTLADIDLITKIVCTIAVSTITIIVALRRRKK